MKMSFRWYGQQNESFPLQYVRQIPGLHDVVGALFDVPVGEVWPLDKIFALKREVESSGLRLETIESVNVHEDIKLGLPSRDRYIENYILTLQNLAQAGINVVCYNFLPVFDWTRTELAKTLPDGSQVLAYAASSEVHSRHPLAQAVIRFTEATANALHAPGTYIDAVMSATPKPGPVTPADTPEAPR